MAGEKCLLLDRTTVSEVPLKHGKNIKYTSNYCHLYIALHILLSLDLKPEILKMEKKATLQTWLTNKKNLPALRENKKKKKGRGVVVSGCC